VPKREGGVFATMSAMPAPEFPLKTPTQQRRAAKTSGVGANAARNMNAPMPKVARSIMILRP
jgi:hypothetical protein